VLDALLLTSFSFFLEKSVEIFNDSTRWMTWWWLSHLYSLLQQRKRNLYRAWRDI
jgi:hypothetical protein